MNMMDYVREELTPQDRFIGASILCDEVDSFNAVIKGFTPRWMIVYDVWGWNECHVSHDGARPAYIRDFLLKRMGFKEVDEDTFELQTANGLISISRVGHNASFSDDTYTVVLPRSKHEIKYMTDLQLIVKALTDVDLRIVEPVEPKEYDNTED